MRLRLSIFLGGLAFTLVLWLGAPSGSPAADYDCSDFASQASAQEFFVASGGPGADPYRLDADGDGIACESNPCPCSTGTQAPAPPITPSPPPAEPEPVRAGAVLERVIDGDTLEVRFPDNSTRSVRLIGIDTPEKYGAVECGAEEASAALGRRVAPGQRIRLISDPSQDNVDVYGRLLRYVELRRTGRDLGKAQIQSGWAKIYVFEDDFRRLAPYKLAQRQARKRRRGVWKRCGGRVHQPVAMGRIDRRLQARTFCLAVRANGATFPVRVLRGNVGCRKAREVLRHFLRTPDRSYRGWKAFYGHGQDIWSVTAFRGPETAPTKLVRAFNPS